MRATDFFIEAHSGRYEAIFEEFHFLAFFDPTSPLSYYCNIARRSYRPFIALIWTLYAYTDLRRASDCFIEAHSGRYKGVIWPKKPKNVKKCQKMKIMELIAYIPLL